MDHYITFAFSRQGANHLKTNPPKPCQDASGSYTDEKMEIIAAADGHGSDDYTRTDIGSKFAVECAKEYIKRFVDAGKCAELDEENYCLKLKVLSDRICREWRQKNKEDLEKHPITEDEIQNVSEKYKDRYLNHSDQYALKAYGTTLIAVCVTKDFWFGLQIGDGKCVAFNGKGAYEPIPWDAQCHENITTSLCDANAEEEFRYCYGSCDNIPYAVFIGSDGVDDSYPYPPMESVFKLYASVLQIKKKFGENRMKEHFELFLDSISKKGSGDDITVCACINDDRLDDAIKGFDPDALPPEKVSFVSKCRAFIRTIWASIQAFMKKLTRKK